MRPCDRDAGIEEAMHACSAREVALVEGITLDDTAQFGLAAYAAAN